MPYPVERNLTNHAPTDEAVKVMVQIRSEAKMLAASIDHYCPESREKSLAFTNLEQSLMWALASIARDGH